MIHPKKAFLFGKGLPCIFLKKPLKRHWLLLKTIQDVVALSLLIIFKDLLSKETAIITEQRNSLNRFQRRGNLINLGLKKETSNHFFLKMASMFYSTILRINLKQPICMMIMGNILDKCTVLLVMFMLEQSLKLTREFKS